LKKEWDELKRGGKGSATSPGVMLRCPDAVWIPVTVAAKDAARYLSPISPALSRNLLFSTRLNSFNSAA
jgi:hypothetical protein